MKEEKFEYTDDHYERLNGFLDRSMRISYGSPDQYQFHQNELTKAIADFLLEPYYWQKKQIKKKEDDQNENK